MKIKLYLLTISLNCFILFKDTNAQSFILYGDKAIGGTVAEVMARILNNGNNQFILSCTSGSNIGGDKTEPQCDSTILTQTDIWLLEVDSGYNIQWNKSLGGESSETFPIITKTGTNNIIFSCYSASDSACEKSQHNRDSTLGHEDYWVCMVDSNGNKIWDKTLGGTFNESSPEIIRLSSGDFIVAGGSDSPVSGNKTVVNYGSNDYWVVKLDSLGNKLWDKVYGGTGWESALSGLQSTVFSVLAEPGTDFILAGTTDSPVSGNISDTSRGSDDVWIIKLDSAGNKIWDKRYGGSGSDRSTHIIHTDDKGYILCGSTNSQQGLDVTDSSRGMDDFWVIKLDSLGNKQWDKRYGGNKDDNAAWIEKAPGGGYWVSGSTASDSGFDVSEPMYGLLSDYWIFKIDSLGTKLWDKRFGGPNDNYGSNFVIMPDSSIFLSGNAGPGTSAVKTDYGKGGRDIWLVNFKYTDNSTGIQENANENNIVTIYPNPTKGKFVLNTNTKGKADVYIYDVMGKEASDKKNVLLNHYEMDVSGFDKGVYFLKAKTGEHIFTKKIMKM